MATVLRVSGPYEPLRQTMLAAPFDFVEAIASRRRRERGEASTDGWSTFNFTISDADGDQVPVQIEESEHFLSRNIDSIQRLRESDAVEGLTLDFSWDFPVTSIGQFNTFPSSLLRECGRLGIDIEISVYATAEDSHAP